MEKKSRGPRDVLKAITTNSSMSSLSSPICEKTHVPSHFIFLTIYPFLSSNNIIEEKKRTLEENKNKNG